jgi:hypothetical protein
MRGMSPKQMEQMMKEGIIGAVLDYSTIEVSNEMYHALLAGGSSQWPFVDEIVREQLSLAGPKVMRSDRPYTVISEGLSILPALQKRCEVAQKVLREEFPRFCNDQLKPLIEERSRE